MEPGGRCPLSPGCSTEGDRGAIFVAHPEAHPPDGPHREAAARLSYTSVGSAVAAWSAVKDGLTKDSNYCGPFFCTRVIFRVYGDH